MMSESFTEAGSSNLVETLLVNPSKCVINPGILFSASLRVVFPGPDLDQGGLERRKRVCEQSIA